MSLSAGLQTCLSDSLSVWAAWLCSHCWVRCSVFSSCRPSAASPTALHTRPQRDKQINFQQPSSPSSTPSTAPAPSPAAQHSGLLSGGSYQHRRCVNKVQINSLQLWADLIQGLFSCPWSSAVKSPSVCVRGLRWRICLGESEESPLQAVEREDFLFHCDCCGLWIFKFSPSTTEC